MRRNNLLLVFSMMFVLSLALDLLLRRAQKPGTWQGPSKTVEYLQRLGM